MFCKKCGKELPDNTTFCSGCGAQLKPSNKSKYEGGEPLEDGKTPFVPPVVPIRQANPVQPVFNSPMNVNEPEPPEENNSKKGIVIAIIAIILAIALIVGGFFLIKYMKEKKDSDDDSTKKESTANQFSNHTVEPITVDPNHLVTIPAVEFVTDENGETVTDKNGEAVTVRPSDIKPGSTTNPSDSSTTTNPSISPTKPGSTTPNTTKPVVSPTVPATKPNPTTNPAPNPTPNPGNWTNQQIIDLYNAAVKKTDPKAPKGSSKLMLVGGITADGAIGSVLQVLTPMITSTLAENSVPTNFVPGAGNITSSDVKSVKISETGSTYIVEMTINEQTDNAFANGNSGPVGKAIGTFGNIAGDIEELGIDFKSGLDTVKIKYTDARIKVVIDKSSGLITSGNWHYIANINVANASANIAVINAVLKNLNMKIDYTVAI